MYRIGEECPVEVAQLIEACLEAEPDARPSAPEIVRALQRIMRLNSVKDAYNTFSSGYMYPD